MKRARQQGEVDSKKATAAKASAAASKKAMAAALARGAEPPEGSPPKQGSIADTAKTPTPKAKAKVASPPEKSTPSAKEAPPVQTAAKAKAKRKAKAPELTGESHSVNSDVKEEVLREATERKTKVEAEERKHDMLAMAVHQSLGRASTSDLQAEENAEQNASGGEDGGDPQEDPVEAEKARLKRVAHARYMRFSRSLKSGLPGF